MSRHALPLLLQYRPCEGRGKAAVTAIFVAFAIATEGGYGELDDFAMDFAIARVGSVIAIPTSPHHG